MTDRPAYVVCRQFWNPKKTRCQKCPIMATCHTRVLPLTVANLESHQERMDAEATTFLNQESA